MSAILRHRMKATAIGAITGDCYDNHAQLFEPEDVLALLSDYERLLEALIEMRQKLDALLD